MGESADNPIAGLYTTSTVYDVLDRPTSRLLAKNGLSTAELGIYDAGFVTFEYDSCANGLGKRCTVKSGNLQETNYIYDWAGRVIEERQDILVPKGITGAKYLTVSRSSYFAYNSSGAVTEQWVPDGPDKASSTHLQYEYNRYTGSPEKLSHYMGVDKKGNPAMQEIAFVTRNRAQRVISQTTGCLTREWDYDILGRVISTEVQGVGCTAQNGTILSESMQYFDSSEVKLHDVYRAGMSPHSFDYNYDSQHQLTTADDSSDYKVTFGYSSDGNGTMDSVSGIDGVLLGRDPMNYSYGDGTMLGADEHTPTTLFGIAKDLDYGYDFAGNVVTRTEVTDPTGSPSQDEWSFRYDGMSQQREVQLNNGNDGRELYYYNTSGKRYMAVTYTNGTDTIPERIRIWMGGAELWYRPTGTSGAMEIDTEYAYLNLGGINIGRIKTQGPVLSTEATFANGLSHIMGSVDWDSGIINAAFIYGPYGEILDSIGAEQDDHLRRFNGKESDQLSKLSYYGYRYYDRQSLSWTQADPKFLYAPDAAGQGPRRMSLYSFSLNNPIRYLDPDGRDPEYQSPLNGSTGTDSINHMVQWMSIKTRADVKAFVEDTIRLWKINATYHGVHGVLIKRKADPNAALGFDESQGIGFILVHTVDSFKDSTSLGYFLSIASVVHEVAHAEYELTFGNSRKAGDWDALIASEKYAYGAEARFYQYLRSQGLITAEELSLLEFAADLSLKGRIQELESLKAAGGTTTSQRNRAATTALIDRINARIGKDAFMKESRAFESNASGNHTFDFIWQNQ